MAKIRQPIPVIHYKNLPVRFPLGGTIIAWLLLDRLNPPDFWWWLVYIILGLWWVGCFANFSQQLRIDLFTRREPMPGPTPIPGHYAAVAGQPGPEPTIKLSPREAAEPAGANPEPPAQVPLEQMTPDQRANAEAARRLRQQGAEIVDGG
jgi:hypothetical protein